MVTFEPNYSKHCYPSKDGDIIDSRINNDPVVTNIVNTSKYMTTSNIAQVYYLNVRTSRQTNYLMRRIVNYQPIRDSIL